MNPSCALPRQDLFRPSSVRRYFKRATLSAVLTASALLGLPGALAANSYPVAPAFGGVVFQEPVQVVFAPGETTRAFVVERVGRIAVISNINNPTRQVILDLTSLVNPPANDSGHGMLSMVFHPHFAQNGYFYIWTSIWESGARYTQLLRYTLSSGGTVDPASQQILISQPNGSGGHDGGTLLFGTDGYLYLSIGDGDEGQAGAEAIASHQRIDEGFYGAVLRIDVDQKPGNLAPNPHLGQQPTGYLVPADNPFVGATSFDGQPVIPSAVRTEFWAVGLRNPFRMSFDSANGDLWVGDVGLSTIEEIDVVTPGGNYGWSFYEGTIPGPNFANLPSGVPFIPPVWEYTHDAGDQCVIGGVVYHGARFPELQGQYIFADYISGRIWAAATPSTRPFATSQVTQIASSDGVVSVGVQPGTGDILLPNLNTGIIQLLGAASTTLVAPSVSSQPVSQTIASGNTVVFSIAASGTPTPTYQWSNTFNGGPIAGATSPTLVLSDATAANAGTYNCLVSNSAGSVNSAAAILTVNAAASPPRLINISCRAQVGTGGNILIAGFVVGGEGTSGSLPLLIRGSGPALVPFGVTGTLPDPKLQLHSTASGGGLLASNSGWGGDPVISNTAATLGAFAWANPSSHDAALIETLAPGPYTANIFGEGNDTGVALAEVYDATPAGTATSTSPRLINISARVQVGTGSNGLIAGFVIGGDTSKTVLIRASGPALIPFGVTGTLPDPELQLHSTASGSSLIATNTGWGGDANIAAAAASVGAFSWGSSATPDSALLITLPPGPYTANVSGRSGDTGVALVEIYEVP